jgi:hypothetical protein
MTGKSATFEIQPDTKNAMRILTLVCPIGRVYSAARERSWQHKAATCNRFVVEKIQWHQMPKPTINLLKTLILMVI